MLIKKNIMKDGEKAIIRLHTNEEIMCEIVTSNDPEHLVVTRPYRLIAQGSGAAIAPWTMIGDIDGEFYFKKDKILGFYPMHPDVALDYIKATTGIELTR